MSYVNQQYKELDPGFKCPFQKPLGALQLNTLNSPHRLPWERSTEKYETKTITDGQTKPLLITQVPPNMASLPELVFLTLLSRGELWLPWSQKGHQES